eukprot:CAMPEP_0174241678 /NCGR_PEP_ID=MMETSP0417-20130205/24344_1 /TAXON_ID=242541 /ORGANISM="Mayorella sp, Strain BSH-02190019" /LENGTH=415 /DNA_ID=CAMNT_0015320949 /DNA_START=181 /DNA_END=1428 /DNA_ORIENTATION=+
MSGPPPVRARRNTSTKVRTHKAVSKDAYKKEQESRTVETEKIFERLRVSHGDITALAKLAKRHHAATEAYIESGRQLAEAVLKLSSHQSGDIGLGLAKIACAQKYNLVKQETVNQHLNDVVAPALLDCSARELKETETFAEAYRRNLKLLYTQLRKLEQKSHKMGKSGNPAKLQESITALTNKMNEIEEIREGKLREALLLERHRFCGYLDLFKNLLDEEMTYHDLALKQIQGDFSALDKLDLDPSHLSEDTKELLIASKQTRRAGELARNPQQIKERISSGKWEGIKELGYGDDGDDGDDGDYEGEGYEEGGYDEGGYDEGGYDGYNTGYAASPDRPGSLPPPPPTRDTGPSFVCTATVQYDFAATEPDQLSIQAGATINIIQRDDGMGNSDWWHAEYQGQTGYVPGVYLIENI